MQRYPFESNTWGARGRLCKSGRVLRPSLSISLVDSHSHSRPILSSVLNLPTNSQISRQHSPLVSIRVATRSVPRLEVPKPSAYTHTDTHLAERSRSNDVRYVILVEGSRHPIFRLVPLPPYRVQRAEPESVFPRPFQLEGGSLIN